MTDNKQIVTPIPGVFYRKPSPEAALYAEEGQTIKEGDVIGLIEVMKNFTEIKSDKAGVLKSFNIENEDVVDAGQVVAELE